VYLDLEEETSKLGMEINEKKTKCMATSTYELRRNVGELRIGNKTFGAVQSFQYLGNITGNTNSNNKCLKERIMMSNKAYYANRPLVNSSLISRNSKLQIYHTLVCPVVTYGSESWTLTTSHSSIATLMMITKAMGTYDETYFIHMHLLILLHKTQQ
jgi:hypothetical protein